MIVAHLGSGASLCAMKDGKSVDSTWASRPSTGCAWAPGRAQSIPAWCSTSSRGWGSRAKEVETILYKKSGLLGISGISNDMRDLLGSSEPAARLAVDYFVYRAAKEIGALAAVLGGIEGWCSPPASARTPPRSAGGSARRARGWGSNSTRRPTPQGSADLAARAARFGLGDPDQRGADDRLDGTRV